MAADGPEENFVPIWMRTTEAMRAQARERLEALGGEASTAPTVSGGCPPPPAPAESGTKGGVAVEVTALSSAVALAASGAHRPDFGKPTPVPALEEKLPCPRDDWHSPAPASVTGSPRETVPGQQVSRSESDTVTPKTPAELSSSALGDAFEEAFAKRIGDTKQIGSREDLSSKDELAQWLRSNPLALSTATFLDLRGKSVGEDGVQALARLLKNNRTLRKLYLDHNEIRPKDCQKLAAALRGNTTLKELWFDDSTLPRPKPKEPQPDAIGWHRSITDASTATTGMHSFLGNPVGSRHHSSLQSGSASAVLFRGVSPSALPSRRPRGDSISSSLTPTAEGVCPRPSSASPPCRVAALVPPRNVLVQQRGFSPPPVCFTGRRRLEGLAAAAAESRRSPLTPRGRSPVVARSVTTGIPGGVRAAPAVRAASLEVPFKPLISWDGAPRASIRPSAGLRPSAYSKVPCLSSVASPRAVTPRAAARAASPQQPASPQMRAHLVQVQRPGSPTMLLRRQPSVPSFGLRPSSPVMVQRQMSVRAQADVVRVSARPSSPLVMHRAGSPSMSLPVGPTLAMNFGAADVDTPPVDAEGHLPRPLSVSASRFGMTSPRVLNPAAQAKSLTFHTSPRANIQNSQRVTEVVLPSTYRPALGGRSSLRGTNRTAAPLAVPMMVGLSAVTAPPPILAFPVGADLAARERSPALSPRGASTTFVCSSMAPEHLIPPAAMGGMRASATTSASGASVNSESSVTPPQMFSNASSATGTPSKGNSMVVAPGMVQVLTTAKPGLCLPPQILTGAAPAKGAGPMIMNPSTPSTRTSASTSFPCFTPFSLTPVSTHVGLLQSMDYMSPPDGKQQKQQWSFARTGSGSGSEDSMHLVSSRHSTAVNGAMLMDSCEHSF